MLLAAVGIGVLGWWFGVQKLAVLKVRPDYGIYPAGSKIADEHALGGFGPCGNFPRNLAEQDWGEAGTVSLVAFPDEAAPGRLAGFVVRLINRTESAVGFAACDSCLFLRQEALDRKGNWRAIELPPRAICGNSFHRVFLAHNQYWEFAARRYSGTFKTRIRFRVEQGETRQLDMGSGANDDEKVPILLPTRGGRLIHSNEFEGWINETLFTDDTSE
ncbi:MAG TPA: hypothetical protein VGE74_03595 [Gemmata sp.]